VLERAFQLQLDHGTAYDQPWGTVQFRKAAAEKYWQFDAASGWGTDNIAFVQGGRDGLQKAYAAAVALGSKEIGAVTVISRVPWITYNWGPYAAGMNVLQAPGRPEEFWRYTPESIKATAEFVKADGRKLACLVITSPDNPTGRTIPVEEQIRLVRAAFDAGFPYVILDWIYHWVTDGGHSDINTVLQAFEPAERDRLIFLDGITKSLGASNIRSAQIVAGKQVIKYLTSQASHGVVPSYFGQAVAIAAYDMGFAQAAAPIIEPIKQSRAVMREMLPGKGMNYVLGDGYYAFIDCSRYIEAGGLGDSEGLLTHLGQNFGLAVVPGIYFSDAGRNWVRFSYALPPDVTRGAMTRLFEGLNALG
jgi:aspartate aminotransferase